VVVMPVVTLSFTLEAVGGQLCWIHARGTEATQVPVKPMVVPPPEVLCAAPGEPLAAHHAGGRLAVGELGAALAVDSLEGVADARLAGFLGGHFRRGQVDRGAAHRAGRVDYEL